MLSSLGLFQKKKIKEKQKKLVYIYFPLLDDIFNILQRSETGVVRESVPLKYSVPSMLR